MQPNADHFTSRVLTIAGTFALLVSAAFLVVKGLYFPQVFQLHFNPYALLSGASFVLTIVLIIAVAKSQARSEEAAWFILLSMAIALFAGAEMMQRLSATPGGAIFWSEVGGIGAALLPVGFLLFAVAYTRPVETRPGAVIAIMITVSAFVALFYSEGNLLYDLSPSTIGSYPWGYNTIPGPAFSLSLTWVFLPSLISVGLFMRFRHINRDQLLRRQALLYAIATGIPLITSLITDGLLPALNLDIFPPLGSTFELITVATIAYGISRYRFFQINPSILADNVLSTMNEAVVVTQPDFMIEFINKEAERLLGIPGEELSQTYIHRLFTPESWPRVHAYLSGETGPEKELGEFDKIAVISSTGRRIPVRVYTSNLIEGGSFQALIFVISDITDITESYNKLETDAARIRKLLQQSHELQKQLQEEKAGVEHTVDVRTKELRQAQERLKAADELKTEFMLLSAHNLRTPITIMAGSIELLKGKGKPSDRDFFMKALEESVNRLRDFVEDMVTITTLEAGSGLVMAPVTADELLQPLITESQAIASTTDGVTFSSDIKAADVKLEANAKRLEGAIRNLLNNAFKFTKSGEVKLTSALQGDHLVIVVKDTGIGIREDEIDKLFTKFHRGTDTIRFEYEGEGIGLYLTKLIITEHHGHIAVDSQLGHGSTFTITLPIVKP